MGIGSFLRPEWKKFILPIVFIILFIVMISSFYYTASVLDKYGCEVASLYERLDTYREQNDTSGITQTVDALESLSQNYKNDMKITEGVGPVLSIVLAIDPIVPVPCEFMVSGLTLTPCQFYASEETYNCMKGSIGGTISVFAEPEIKEYKGVSVATLGLNVLLLFVEGYLISAVVLFIYRKIRSRGNKTAVLQPPVPKASRAS